jgi:hypothetical protein
MRLAELGDDPPEGAERLLFAAGLPAIAAASEDNVAAAEPSPPPPSEPSAPSAATAGTAATAGGVSWRKVLFTDAKGASVPVEKLGPLHRWELPPKGLLQLDFLPFVPSSSTARAAAALAAKPPVYECVRYRPGNAELDYFLAYDARNPLLPADTADVNPLALESLLDMQRMCALARASLAVHTVWLLDSRWSGASVCCRRVCAQR